MFLALPCSGLRASFTRAERGPPGSVAAHPGVEEVSQRVADDVEGEDGEHDGETRERGDPRAAPDVLTPVAQDIAPGGRGRGNAQAEERETRLGADSRRDVEGGYHDERVERVRKHVSGHEPELSRSDRLRGHHVVVLADGEGEAPGQAYEVRQERYPDGEDLVDQRPAERRHDDQREEQRGEGHQHVGAAHDGRLGAAAAEPGEDAERYADREGNHHRGETDLQRDARAPDDAAQDVPSELVRPQPVPLDRAWALEDGVGELRRGAHGARRGAAAAMTIMAAASSAPMRIGSQRRSCGASRPRASSRAGIGRSTVSARRTMAMTGFYRYVIRGSTTA